MQGVLSPVGLILLALVAGCTAQGDKPPPQMVAVDIVYATDRDVTGQDRLDKYFGTERSVLSFGRATVTVEPVAGADAGYWPPRDAASDKSKLVDIQPGAVKRLADLIEADMPGRGERTALVYIHGYKKNFERAAKNLAQIVYGADYRGVPVLFSWPAGNSPVGYASDTTTLRWSTHNFVNTLNDLADAEDLDTVHLVAHSMGSQAVLHALENARPPAGDDEWTLGELVLYAPDVDRERFLRDAMPVLREAQVRTTLYVSDLDVPLMSSRVVNKYPRLGDAKAALTIAPGLETIDVSLVSGLFTTHIYHLTQRIQEDLGLLLNQRLGAAERPTLVETANDQGRYWQLLPLPEEED